MASPPGAPLLRVEYSSGSAPTATSIPANTPTATSTLTHTPTSTPTVANTPTHSPTATGAPGNTNTPTSVTTATERTHARRQNRRTPTAQHTPTGVPGATVEVRVSVGGDDAEENAGGAMYLTSSDLELVYDTSNQTVGMRFSAVDIPQGATIAHAYVQFMVDQGTSGATSLRIEGQSSDNAPAFATSTRNISSRARTTAAVQWSPVSWMTIGAAGVDQRTPNLAPIIQEIVNRAGWVRGNALVIIITGTGSRVAEAYNGFPTGAPLLHLEY